MFIKFNIGKNANIYIVIVLLLLYIYNAMDLFVSGMNDESNSLIQKKNGWYL